MSRWDAVEVEPGTVKSLTVGNLELRFLRVGTEWRIAVDGSPVTGIGLIPGWRVFPTLGDCPPRLVPATPDLPVVLKPENSIALLPGTSVSYDVSLPLWVKVLVSRGRKYRNEDETMMDIPSRLLKRTWFGTGESGEVAYGWRFEPGESNSKRPDRFIVPLTIVNGSESTLWFERFLLRVGYFDLYEQHGSVSSNAVTVTFRGTEQLSQISYGQGKLLIDAGYRKIGSQRQSAANDLIRKSFVWLRDLAV